MIPRALRALAAASVVLAPACSDGAGGPATVTEQGLRVVAATPPPNGWTAEQADVALTFNRTLDPASVRLRTLVVRERGGAEVEGHTTVDGATLRWVPARPLPEGWYDLESSPDVRGADGSEWRTFDALRVGFAVRRSAGTWSRPTVLGTAGTAAPLLVGDGLGGAAAVWMAEGQVRVAEFDRDRGWLPATAAMPIPISTEVPLLLAARGSNAMAVALVQAQPGLLGQSTVHLAVSRTFDSEGRRVFAAPATTFLEMLRQPPQLWVDAEGTALMLLVSPVSERQALRMVRFAGRGVRSDERLSAVADQVIVERVDLSQVGDVAVVWNEVLAGEGRRFVRIARQPGLEAAAPLDAIGAPRDGGFDGDGNAWLLAPVSTTTMRYRVQSNRQWSHPGVELPYDVAHLTSFALDLLTLDWRSTAGAGTLLANRVDRLGRALSSVDLYGPTLEALEPLSFTGDPDQGALALWRADDHLLYSRLRRGASDALTWTPARSWQLDHAPVPVERAVITRAGRGRTYFTFVDRGRLSTTYEDPYHEMARPVRDELGWTEGDPLLGALFAGTNRGRLLLVTRVGATFHGQWFE